MTKSSVHGLWTLFCDLVSTGEVTTLNCPFHGACLDAKLLWDRVAVPLGMLSPSHPPPGMLVSASS